MSWQAIVYAGCALFGFGAAFWIDWVEFKKSGEPFDINAAFPRWARGAVSGLAGATAIVGALSAAPQVTA